jgi:hemoglobin
MLKQCAQQQAFITMVTGGPANYEGRNMKSAHCKLNINKEEFDITWNHLKASLEHF